MCGLVGVAGNLFDNDIQRFKNLLSADRIRGPFAAGIGVAPHGNTNYVKLAGDVESLLDLDSVKKILNTRSNVIIGHNRWPTVGGNKSENAHPYIVKHILGAHNGTISDQQIRALPVETNGATDSLRLFQSIAEVGIEKTVEFLHGAWALTWFDENEQTLNFLRNKDRPLYMVTHKGGNRIAWASEGKMLDWIMSRKEQGMPDWDYDKNGIVEVPPDVLITVELEKVGIQPLKITHTPIKQECYRPQPQKKSNWKEKTGGSTTEQTNLIDFLEAQKKKAIGPRVMNKSLTEISYDDLYAENAAIIQSRQNLSLKRNRIYEELSNINWSMQWNWHETFRKCMMGKVAAIYDIEVQRYDQLRRGYALDNEMKRRDDLRKDAASTALMLASQPKEEKGIVLADYFQSFERQGIKDRIAFQAMVHAFHGCAFCGTDNWDAFQPTERPICLPGPGGPVGMVCTECVESPKIQTEIVQTYGAK